MRALASLILLALTPLLQAQDSCLRFLPKDPLMVLVVAGPKTLLTALQQTQAGKAVAASDLRASLEALVGWLAKDAEFEPLLANLEPKAVLDAALGYDGRFAMGIGMPPPGAQPIEERAPLVAFVLGPDPRIDPASLLLGFTLNWAKDSDEAPDFEVKFGERKLRVRRESPDDPWLTEPLQVDDHIVMYGSDPLPADIAQEVAGAAGAAKLLPQALHNKLAAIWVPPQVRELILAELAAEGPTAEAVLRVSGLLAFGGLSCTLEVEGEQIVQRGQVALDPGQPRGIFDLMAPPSQPLRGLLSLVPPDCTAWTLYTLHLSALPALGKRVVDTLGEAAPLSWEEIEQQAKDFLKVDVAGDLLAHVGDRILAVQSSRRAAETLPMPTDEMAAREFAAELSGAAIALELKQGEAFGKGLERLIRARGLHATRKTVVDEGQRIHRIAIAGFPLEYAVTDRLFVLSWGSSGAHDLRVLLARDRARAAGQPLPEPAVGAIPDDCVMVDVTDTAGNMRNATELMQSLFLTLQTSLAKHATEDEAKVQREVLGRARADFERLQRTLTNLRLPLQIGKMRTTPTGLVFEWRM